MTDVADVPVKAVEWKPSYRLIASRYPTVALYDAIADPADLEVVFAIAAGTDALWLPESAIWRRGELSGVYVVTDKTVLLRQLRLGEIRAGRVEVLSGVTAGERIAADPAQAALALAVFKTGKER